MAVLEVVFKLSCWDALNQRVAAACLERLLRVVGSVLAVSITTETNKERINEV